MIKVHFLFGDIKVDKLPVEIKSGQLSFRCGSNEFEQYAETTEVNNGSETLDIFFHRDVPALRNEKMSLYINNKNQQTHSVPSLLKAEHLADLLRRRLDAKIKGGMNIQLNMKETMEMLGRQCVQTLASVVLSNMANRKYRIAEFCHCFYLIKQLQISSPREVNSLLNDDVDSFMGGATGKKQGVPDIGWFLLEVLLTGRYDESIKPALFREHFARQVHWMNRNFAVNHNEKNVTTRLDEAFKASHTSNKIFAFQKTFFAQVLSLSVVSDLLCETHGLPSRTLVDHIAALIAEEPFETYAEFAQVMGIEDILPTPEATFEQLNLAVRESNKQRYTTLVIA